MRKDDYITREAALREVCHMQCNDSPENCELPEVKYCGDYRAVLTIPPADVMSKDLIDKRIKAALEVLLEVERRGQMTYDDYSELRDAINEIGRLENAQ